MRLALPIALLMFASCATLPPAEAPLADVSDVSPSTLRIRVIVTNDPPFNPYCSVPDASDTTTCQFSWEWLQKGDLTVINDSGWEGLTPNGARRACSVALFSLGPMVTYSDIQTCGFLLMYTRVRLLPPDKTPPEAQ